MKKRKIIGGVLAVLMLCGILVGCSSNSAQTAPYEKGTITETEFTSKWMGLKYTLPNGMVMMTEEYLESLAASSKVQMEMQALMDDNSGDNIVVLTEDLVLHQLRLMKNVILNFQSPKQKLQLMKLPLTKLDQRTIAGKTFYELPYHLSMEIDGTNVTLDQTFLCKKLGDRMICMTLTHSGEDSINYLLSGFSKYNQPYSLKSNFGQSFLRLPLFFL